MGATRARVLVGDHERSGLEIQQLLGGQSLDLVLVDSAELAVSRALESGGDDFDVILLEFYLPEQGGAHVLRELRRNHVPGRVIIMSRTNADEVAVEAMRIGAFDFMAKPVTRAELRLRVERALRDRAFDAPMASPGRKRPRKSDVIIGGGRWIKELYESISMAAPTDVTVAIYGESGTGKELVARTIHNLSHRHEGPFVVVNCAAIPENLLEDELFGHVKGAFTDANRDREGLFSAADGGTLFLDEIGEMPLVLQAKILRVLQSREFRRIGDDRDTQVDVRVITATNRDLEQAVASGVFRQDLFYRINVFPLVLPPLRKRPEDIPLLAHHFLLKHRTRVGKSVEGFTPQAISKLRLYDFPGNVRELENKVHQALVMAQGDHILPGDLQLGDVDAASHDGDIDLSRPFRDLKKEVVEAFERRYTLELLRAHGGNVAAASRQAGMDRKNLWTLAKKYDIDLESIRHE
jgi:DNA-binding NtrC family response regulator